MCFTLLTVRCCFIPVPTGVTLAYFLSLSKWSLLFPLPQATANADLCPALHTAFEQPNRTYAKQSRDWEIQPLFSPVTVGTVCLWALSPAHSPSWITTGNSPSCLVLAASSDCVSTPGSLHMPFLQWQMFFLCLLLVPFLPLWQDTLVDHVRPRPQLLYPIQSLTHAFLSDLSPTPYS